ncbi:E3 ubiquitin-protein ligase At1g12760-like [Prosopis cineraria]|uniref:E3 ubiquitin-protein ligase At1g12760-like n=1 Tax=Prosopis cineraria TaxID=364024 RepID=UPI00240F0FAA|nr:E3 ubiquitin-protein ligase At1g12760-like [Prosopis cineraria]
MNSSEAEEQTVSVRNRSVSDSFMIGMVMRIYRARWFVFLRRVFQYQNGSRSDIGSNPFNSATWMTMELVALMVQITASTATLAISQEEKPVWPMRFWILGYEIGCVLSLLLLYGRYRLLHLDQSLVLSLSDLEQQRGSEQDETRACALMNKCRSSLELMFGIWFVMGNVWVFGCGYGSIHRAPKLHVLCISLLAWNAISYSFPFMLFLLLCCFLPLLCSLLGHSPASPVSPASDQLISLLPSRPYAPLPPSPDSHDHSQEHDECCICLAKYKEKEQVRELPCNHIFHQKCVDQWLRIISCCPLCKQGIGT